jgi:DNA-binding NarL/FixJ family response regulator
MDIKLPGINGYEACAAILQNNPAAKILGMSMNAEPQYAIRMIQDGAMGYVTKNSPQEEIFEALAEIYNNRKYVSRDIINKLEAAIHGATTQLEEKKQLTQQEIEIIIYIRLGLTAAEISEKPGFTKEIVDAQLLQVLYKLDLPAVTSLRTFPAY